MGRGQIIYPILRLSRAERQDGAACEGQQGLL